MRNSAVIEDREGTIRKAHSPFGDQGKQEWLCHRLNDWNGWFARGGVVRHTRESPR